MGVVGNLGLYFVFLIPPLVFGLAVQAWLKRTVARNAQIEVSSGLSGAQVARQILDRNGLDEVGIHRAPGGALSDHYDPRKREVFLSEAVHDARSVTATAIAAHEVGHAIQHARAYTPMQIRSTMFPVVAFASSFWTILLIGGLVLGALGLVQLAILLYAVAVLFHFVTLPVEFNASKRAGAQLGSLGLVSTGESQGVKRVLNAAALTYVAGALAALTQLLYFALLFLGNRD
jgi:Zn-dependent membrane protease YugP